MGIMFPFLLSSTAFSSDYAPQTAKWKYKPDIVVCKDSTVKIETIQRAVKFWEAKGHEFGTISYVDDCLDYHSGYILFVGDVDLNDSYAGTCEIFDYGGMIVSAYIEIWDDARNNLKVIVHELGHALGYDHSKSIYNVRI